MSSSWFNAPAYGMGDPLPGVDVQDLVSRGYRRHALPGVSVDDVVCLGASQSCPDVLRVRVLDRPDPTRPNVIVLDGLTYGLLSVTFAGSGNVLRIGRETALNKMQLVMTDASQIHIGEGVQAAGGCEVQARNGGSVEIGAGGLLAYGCQLLTDDMHEIYDVETGESLNGFGGRITLAERVWLGAGSLLLGSLTMGSDCVVGARAVVTRDIPPSSVAAGVPARVVRSGVAWRAIDSRSAFAASQAVES